MASLTQRLAAGLAAQDWRETAAHGPWQRWGKFGRGAMYVLNSDAAEYQHLEGQHLLWFSELHQREPEYEVQGPILEQLLAAGDLALAKSGAKLDTEALLIELLYK